MSEDGATECRGFTASGFVFIDAVAAEEDPPAPETAAPDASGTDAAVPDEPEAEGDETVGEGWPKTLEGEKKQTKTDSIAHKRINSPPHSRQKQDQQPIVHSIYAIVTDQSAYAFEILQGCKRIRLEYRRPEVKQGERIHG
jgi:hypothetical protein